MTARLPKRRDREVLDAAAKVFFERGYADASVQDVADELGILKGSLYHYIETKEDLLFRLLDETHEEVSRLLDEARDAEGFDVIERLRLYVRRQVEFNLDNLERVAVYYHDLDCLSEQRRAQIVARRKEHERFVVELILEAQRAGRADASLDAHMLSRCVFATIIWTHKWFRPGRDRRDAIASTSAEFTVRGVVGGAAPAPGTPVA